MTKTGNALDILARSIQCDDNEAHDALDVVKGLASFAHGALDVLETDEAWSPDTVSKIADLACKAELAMTDDGGFFRVTVPRVGNGIVYFSTFEEARNFGQEHGKGFPAWRVVPYLSGWAVQLTPSGDYMDPDGRPRGA